MRDLGVGSALATLPRWSFARWRSQGRRQRFRRRRIKFNKGAHDHRDRRVSRRLFPETQSGDPSREGVAKAQFAANL